MVIPSWEALSLEERGFVPAGRAVTESHDLLLSCSGKTTTRRQRDITDKLLTLMSASEGAVSQSFKYGKK